MALYTKQELKDAYLELKEVDTDLPEFNENSWFAAEIIRVQDILDANKSLIQARIDTMTEQGLKRLDRLNARKAAVNITAKEHMKKLALEYIADQAEEQSDVDNAGVNL